MQCGTCNLCLALHLSLVLIVNLWRVLIRVHLLAHFIALPLATHRRAGSQSFGRSGQFAKRCYTFDACMLSRS
jgi:hypothetical protein